jgi:hypothetical protein
MVLFGIKLLFDETFDANNNRLGLFVSIVDMCCRRLMNSTYVRKETEKSGRKRRKIHEMTEGKKTFQTPKASRHQPKWLS